MTRWLRNYVAFFAGFLAICVVARAMGDELPAPPQITVGVTQCGEVVALWVVTKSGKFMRVDADHHPDAKNYNEFLTWLAGGAQDLVAIPCGASGAGGKPRTRAPS